MYDNEKRYFPEQPAPAYYPNGHFKGTSALIFAQTPLKAKFRSLQNTTVTNRFTHNMGRVTTHTKGSHTSPILRWSMSSVHNNQVTGVQ
jgi:hypothetical protein